MSLFGLDALASAANRMKPTSVPMPMFYEKDRETEEEAKVAWDIEEATRELTELECVNLTGHLDNRTRFGI